MKKTDGHCRIDAVHIGEASFNLMGASPVLLAKYALINSTAGVSVGAGNRNGAWSERTMTKLFELAESMEQDITEDIFDQGATISGGPEPTENATDGVPGL